MFNTNYFTKAGNLLLSLATYALCLTTLVVLLLQSCKKEEAEAIRSQQHLSTSYFIPLDSVVFYKQLVARCVTNGLSDAEFGAFFKKVSARGEGNQIGFSLWHYRDSLVKPAQTLADYLASQSEQIGTPYNRSFFRGHLVRAIPNLSIGISIWEDVTIQDFPLDRTLKVAVLPENYYSADEDAGVATVYSQGNNSLGESIDTDNANFSFVFVGSNPYFHLFKTSNKRSLAGDKTLFQLYAINPGGAVEHQIDRAESGSKFRIPGVEYINGQSVYLVDAGEALNFIGGGSGPNGDPPTGGGGRGQVNVTEGDDPDPVQHIPTDTRDLDPCEGGCERDNLDGQERVRFLKMVDGKDLRKWFGCKRSHRNCNFKIINTRYVANASQTQLSIEVEEKACSLWEKGLRKGEWVWWNDDENAFFKWEYCEGKYADKTNYRVIGVNPQSGETVTTTIIGSSTGIVVVQNQVNIDSLLALDVAPNSIITITQKQNDHDFGQTQFVYYCDPISENNWHGKTYSTGSVNLRIREKEDE
jgi:hypothetical protein